MKRIVSLAIVLAILLTALAFSEGMWTCTSCGSSGNTRNFCTNCGAKRQDESWTCPSCGTSGNVSNFCPNCGTRRPENTAVLAADANAEADWNVGDTVLFGSYEQDGDASGNSEPIEWLVLEVNDHDALLLSKKALVCHAYHDVNEEVTWESCTLRQWLNGYFMDSAFTAAERENILPSHVEDAPNPSFGTPAGNAAEDYVYLLSIGEAERYLPEADDRFCVPTVCTMDDGALTSTNYLSNGEMSCDWWLRSPGYSGNCAADVYVDGYIYAEGLPVDSLGCVRPVMRVCYPLNVKKTEEVKISTPVPQVTIQPTLVPTATPAPTNTPTPHPTNAIGTGTNDYAIGDIVTFGTYPQTAEGNDDTPIEWIVLDKNGDEYLLISKLILDCQQYHTAYVDIGWEDCTLRSWLNDDFYNSAFNAKEKMQVVSTTGYGGEVGNSRIEKTTDKVFLLNENSVKTYFNNNTNRRCKSTQYAHAKGVYSYSGTCSWWLINTKDSCNTAVVGEDGSVAYSDVTYDDFGVRPCIWVRLDESVFSGAASATEEASTTERPSFQTETASASTVSGAGTLSMPSGKTVFGSPEYSANIICRTTGDDLKYISYDNGWYYVILPDGSCGYVNENGCKVEQYAESDLDRKPTSKDKYGTLKIDAGTNIRSGSSTNSSVVLTTVVNKTFKYVSCENGWYKIILDDGSYAYVYYTRATVSERAPGDDGTYGIKSTSGSSSSSGSGSGSGTGGSGSQHDPSCDDPDISKHKLFYLGEKYRYSSDGGMFAFHHYIYTYKCYSCSCGKNTYEEYGEYIGSESCTYVWNNAHEYHICSKCGTRLLDEGWSGE